MCSMTSLSNSSQSTRPTGRVLWEELLILSRFHEWNFCPLLLKQYSEQSKLYCVKLGGRENSISTKKVNRLKNATLLRVSF